MYKKANQVMDPLSLLDPAVVSCSQNVKEWSLAREL
jgi:hypothetical protein